jgi:hypothetical protein
VTEPERVPFEYLHHLVTVPVRVGDVEARLVFDTGMGLVLLTDAVASEAGCVPTGKVYTGARMSGQQVEVPVGQLGALSFGGAIQRDLPVGILDVDEPKLADVGGFLSLACFRDRPVTFDYPRREIVVETASSLAERLKHGTSVGVAVEQDELVAEVFLPLDVPGAGTITVEVDTGSDNLILDESLAETVGVDLSAPDVRVVEGQDETGYTYRRTFTTLPGTISPAGAPHIERRDPRVMFQKIIYDGLVGDSFLREFVVTYDLAGSRMVFAT